LCSGLDIWMLMHNISMYIESMGVVTWLSVHRPVGHRT